MGEIMNLYFSRIKLKIVSVLVLLMGITMFYLFYKMNDYSSQITKLQLELQMCKGVDQTSIPPSNAGLQ